MWHMLSVHGYLPGRWHCVRLRFGNLQLMLMCDSHSMMLPLAPLPPFLLPPAFELQAARPVVGRLSRSSAGGAGGAIHLGLWGSQVLLYNSTFTNNSATQFGGAVHSLAIDGSSLQLDGVNATGNTAALVPPSTSDADLIASALRSEGGCLHVDGSSVSVNISRSVMNTNMAGRVSALLLVCWSFPLAF
jgi:predicted outer membrane repeat protein